MKRFFLLLIMLSAVPMYCQTLHLVSVGGSKYDGKTGHKESQTHKMSMKILNERMNEIASLIQFDYKLTQVTGDKFDLSQLNQSLYKIKIQPYDIVVLSILAHGHHNSNIYSPFTQKISTFPTTRISYNHCELEEEECVEKYMLPFENFVKKYYIDKNPQLLIALVDACNTKVDFTFKLDENYNVNKRLFEPNSLDYITNGPSETKAKELFLNRKGIVMISSTSIGELAAGSPNSGSLYTISFCNSIKDMLSNNDKINFSGLLSNLKNALKSKIKNKLVLNRQTPQVFNQSYFLKYRHEVPQNDIRINRNSFSTSTDYLSQGRKELLVGNYNKARRTFLTGLEHDKDNIDLKLAVFICEVSLRYDKFSTIHIDQLCDIVESFDSTKPLSAPSFKYLQYALGIAYLYGDKGCEKNFKKGIYWMRKSSDNGLINACYILADYGARKCLKNF